MLLFIDYEKTIIKKNPASFVPNKKIPIYNWFYYKEGFSRDLVIDLIKKFNIKKNQIILDPFCGSGTTLVASRETGINSIGFDVLDIAFFASVVKTRDYSNVLDELKKTLQEIKNTPKKKEKIRIKEKIILKAFPDRILSELLYLKQNIKKIKNKIIRDFFLLCLINTSTKTTLAIKDGGCIKIDKSRHLPPVKYMFVKLAKKMINDIDCTRFGKAETQVFKKDTRIFRLKENSIDCVITSPPYLNKIEYANVYFIEEYLFLKKKLHSSLRSFIGKNYEKISEKMKNENLKDMLDDFIGKPNESIIVAYFIDIFKSLENMYFCLKKNKYCAIVIGGGCFDFGVVQTDVIVSKIAEIIGFKIMEIMPLRKIICTKNRTKKIGVVNESLLILKKN